MPSSAWQNTTPLPRVTNKWLSCFVVLLYVPALLRKYCGLAQISVAQTPTIYHIVEQVSTIYLPTYINRTPTTRVLYHKPVGATNQLLPSFPNARQGKRNSGMFENQPAFFWCPYYSYHVAAHLQFRLHLTLWRNLSSHCGICEKILVELTQKNWDCMGIFCNMVHTRKSFLRAVDCWRSSPKLQDPLKTRGGLWATRPHNSIRISCSTTCDWLYW